MTPTWDHISQGLKHETANQQRPKRHQNSDDKPGGESGGGPAQRALFGGDRWLFAAVEPGVKHARSRVDEGSQQKTYPSRKHRNAHEAEEARRWPATGWEVLRHHFHHPWKEEEGDPGNHDVVKALQEGAEEGSEEEGFGFHKDAIWGFGGMVWV